MVVKELYTRFVEPGRVAFIADGPYRGKITVIVDVINRVRVLADGPESGVPRQMTRVSDLHLTKFKLDLPYNASSRLVRKEWKKMDMTKKWEESNWFKHQQMIQKRRSLTDFERFKLRRAKRARNYIEKTAFKSLLKAKRKTDYFKPSKVLREKLRAIVTKGKN